MRYDEPLNAARRIEFINADHPFDEACGTARELSDR
jgi:hypothetical protein